MKPSIESNSLNWRDLLKRISPSTQSVRVTMMHGQLLRAKGYKREAIAAFECLLEAEPRHTGALHAVGTLHREAGNPSLARQFLSRYYQCHVDEAGVQGITDAAQQIDFHLAAEGLATTPHMPPSGYVEHLFDGYSGNFEQHLTSQLGYDVPVLVSTLLLDPVNYLDTYSESDCNKADSKPAGELDILDLGCGTGLVGQSLREYAKCLIGVDVSSGMLDKCRDTNSYNELVKSDICEYLASNHSVFDLVVAFDVFNYFGDLRSVLSLCRARQAPGNLLAFTVESGDQFKSAQSYSLAGNLRYQHGLLYLQNTADQCHYKWIKHLLRPIRQEQRCDVMGYLVLLAACDSPSAKDPQCTWGA